MSARHAGKVVAVTGSSCAMENRVDEVKAGDVMEGSITGLAIDLGTQRNVCLAEAV